MNRLIFSRDERVGDQLEVTGRRAAHVVKVLRLKVGDTLRVGERDGVCATARVLALSQNSLQAKIEILHEPLPVSSLKVILALPRPKALGRILESLTELGVKDIVLLHAAKVEKSYWQAHQLKDSEIEKHLLMGLELAGDTYMPRVLLAKRFRPFVEDDLSHWAGSCQDKWVLHPRDVGEAAAAVAGRGEWQQSLQSGNPQVCAIGPEGGWTDFEVKMLLEQGFKKASLGARVLSSETVAAVVAGWALPRSE
jgi:16S rRNA (uracil1498-N3)-methyltransferase